MRGLGVALLVAVVALAVVALPCRTGASSAGADHDPIAAVFTSTNSATHNQIVAFERSSGGTLTWVADYSSPAARVLAPLSQIREVSPLPKITTGSWRSIRE